MIERIFHEILQRSLKCCSITLSGLGTYSNEVKSSKDLLKRVSIDEMMNLREDIVREILIEDIFAEGQLIIVLFEHNQSPLVFGLF